MILQVSVVKKVQVQFRTLGNKQKGDCLVGKVKEESLSSVQSGSTFSFAKFIWGIHNTCGTALFGELRVKCTCLQQCKAPCFEKKPSLYQHKHLSVEHRAGRLVIWAFVKPWPFDTLQSLITPWTSLENSSFPVSRIVTLSVRGLHQTHSR